MPKIFHTIFVLLLCFGIVSVAIAQEPSAKFTLSHEEIVVYAEWNHDETQILTASDDLFVWDAETGEQVLQLKHDGLLNSAHWNQDGTQILSTTDSQLYLWDTDKDSSTFGQIIFDKPQTTPLLKAQWNQDETQILAVQEEGSATIYDAESAENLFTLEHIGRNVLGFDWSHDESMIRSWSEDGVVRIWDAETGEQITNYQFNPTQILLGLAWNDDETEILAWYANDMLGVWETNGMNISRNPRITMSHRSFVGGARWNETENQILSWSGDDTATLWNAENGQLIRRLIHEDWVKGAVWDAESSQILSWSHTRAVVWNESISDRTSLNNADQRFQHTNFVQGAVWNADATQVLSWSWDQTARVWDVPTNE